MSANTRWWLNHFCRPGPLKRKYVHGLGRTDVFQGHMLEGQDQFRPLEMHIENATGTWVRQR